MRTKRRQIDLVLFIAQRLHGIDSSGAEGRQIGSGERHEGQERGDCGECKRVVRFDAVGQIRDEASEAESCDEADDDAYEGDAQPLAEDHA